MKAWPLKLFLVCCATMTAGAQNSWTNRYSGAGQSDDRARAIAVDGNGNVFMTGSSASDGFPLSSSYATIKYSNDGVPLWTNSYRGPGSLENWVATMAVDSNGDVLVTGISGDIDNYDFATVKYSNAGMPLWTNRYDGPGNGVDEALAMALDGSGNVFVTGASFGSVSSGYDYATIKYSNAGMPLWTNRYSKLGQSFSRAWAIAVDGSGNVMVTGESDGSTGGRDYATIKYSNDGVPLWTNRYDGPGQSDAGAWDIAVDSNGNVFVTGTSGGMDDYDFATVKYSSAGMPLWTNRYNGRVGNGILNALAMALDGSGSVFVTGRSRGGVSGGYDYATIKYSNDGVPLWTNRYNGPGNGNDYANAIAVDGDGNVLVTGESDGSTGSRDYATIKYSNDGVPLWTNRYNGPGPIAGYDTATAIAVDGDGNVVLTGYSTGTDGSFDFVTIKYGAAPPPAILENPQASASEFSFALVAEPGGQFALQVTTNLMNWETVRQVTIPASGSTNIVETLAPAAGQKYYRAQRQ